MDSKQAKSIMRDADYLIQELIKIIHKINPNMKYHEVTKLEDYGDYITISFSALTDGFQ